MQKYSLYGFIVLAIIIGIVFAMKLIQPREEDICKNDCLSKGYFDGICQQLPQTPQPCENENEFWVTNEDPNRQLCLKNTKPQKILTNTCCCVQS